MRGGIASAGDFGDDDDDDDVVLADEGPGTPLSPMAMDDACDANRAHGFCS